MHAYTRLPTHTRVPMVIYRYSTTHYSFENSREEDWRNIAVMDWITWVYSVQLLKSVKHVLLGGAVTSVVAAATYCDLCVPCKPHILADNSGRLIAILQAPTFGGNNFYRLLFLSMEILDVLTELIICITVNLIV